MPTLINITCPGAVGKSTICELLVKELKTFAFVDSAYLKKMLKPIGKEYAKPIANNSIIFIIKELIKLNKNVLVQEQNIDNLKAKLDLNGYKAYSFFLTCPVDEALKRNQLRKEPAASERIKDLHQRIKPSINDMIIDTQKHTKEHTVNLIIKAAQV